MNADLTPALIDYLLDQTSLTNLIGTRLIPVNAKQGTTTEYVVYSKVAHRPIRHLKGRSDLFESHYKFVIEGYSYTNVSAIANVLNEIFETVVTTIGDFKIKFMKIIDFSNEDDFDKQFPGEQKLLLQRELIAVIWHRSEE